MKKGVLYLVLVILVSSIVFSATSPTAPTSPGSTPTGPTGIGGPSGPGNIGGPSGPGSIGGPGTPGLPGTTTNTCYSGDGICVAGCLPADLDCFLTPGCFDFDVDNYGMGCTLGLDCNDANAAVNPGATEICGNGIDEDCLNGDATCPGSLCGNSIVDSGETCDDGNGISTDACVLCSNAVCGDGFIYSGVETCDDSNIISGDGCSSTCQLEGIGSFCGDGIVDAGEVCDDGNSLNDDSCVLCQTAVCGDSYVRTGLEACDDGNTIDTDSCSNSCTFTTPTCSLSTAVWAVSSAVQSSVVSFSVDASSCEGETLSYEVFEDDVAVDEPVTLNPVNTIIVGGTTTGSWTAEWQCDGDVGGVCLFGNPEYYFVAKVLSDPSIETTSGLLTTTAASSVCGNGIVEGSEMCDDGVLDGVICDSSCMIPIGACVDLDGDGHGVGCPAGLDCDDTNPTTFFGAPEICIDGVDNNCIDGINEISICAATGGSGGNNGGGGSGGGSGQIVSNHGYPGLCYNGRLDVKEEGVDCGGICVKQCSTAVVPQSSVDQNIVPVIPTIGKPPVSQDESGSNVPILVGGLILLSGLGGVAYYFVHKRIVSGAIGAAKVDSNAFEVAKRYVQNYMKLGYNQKDISGQMLKSGWKQEDIDNVFSQIGK